MASDDRHTLKAHFLDGFAYDLWATERVVDAVDALPEGEAKAEGMRLASHLVRAGTRWLERILDGRSTTVDKVDDAAAIRERARANARAWTALLEERRAADFSKDVTYHGRDGVAHRAALRVVVAHVLNHGTHHRGQVVRHIRLAGVEPPVTDLHDWDAERRSADEGA